MTKSHEAFSDKSQHFARCHCHNQNHLPRTGEVPLAKQNSNPITLPSRAFPAPYLPWIIIRPTHSNHPLKCKNLLYYSVKTVEAEVLCRQVNCRSTESLSDHITFNGTHSNTQGHAPPTAALLKMEGALWVEAMLQDLSRFCRLLSSAERFFHSMW